jgi:hypothetical protein
MNILQIVQSAALSLDLEIPDSVFSSTERTWREMADVCNTAALQILNEYDWSDLLRVATVTGDGAATSFPFPADFSHMIKDANLWSPALVWYPSQQVQDFNQWLGLLTYPLAEWNTRWMMYGGELHVQPTLPAGSDLKYGYVSKAIVGGNSGGSNFQDRFENDSDEFRLDDELLRLSIIWNWKEKKGFDFVADLAKYQQRLEDLRWVDVGSRQTIIGGVGRRGYYGVPGGFV